MAKSTVKRKATPSSLRKKKAQQRIRKQIRTKLQKKKPSWKTALAKVYTGGANTLKDKKKDSRKRVHSGDDDGDDEENTFNFKRDGDDEDGEVQSDVDEEKEERLNQRDPLETQLFLKNLPLDTSEEELMTYFKTHFSAVKRVLLVRNRASKALSGTGFVHCGSAEVAGKIFDYAQQNARELSAVGREDMKAQTESLSHHQAKRLMHKMRTDSFVVRDPFLTMRDTKFTVLRVLSRSDTQEAVSAQQKKKKRTKVAADDPRNLYLLQEGLVLPGSAAAKGLHPRYLQMIEDDYAGRKQQLTNSNYFVSKTRLSVRNLPRTMSENDMRRLFAEQARAYLKKHPEDAEKGKWGKYGPIRNVKLLKDTAGVSRGYGFIEFVNHNVALNTLRMLNNNPTVFGDQRRLMVSFAIENMSAVQKLQRMKELKRARLARGSSNGRASAVSSKAKKSR
ncbi:putative RNA-binding protein [Leishmania mexicana MHOM/GT/2001/U1103]|uniref:RNA-binding protein n=1 Tax=Leishmania mexicana (strain MHOM/GT/2001/U1103) TaxID=929439 RepID=E9B360_LEIMU|nr:putative RNA-binding protein [Leishmania mexicana MHOM/GT/2001/U1103]CBZ29676.1 putative RNA-binding protein [Leishmania mexicana MHOM/GT/2001/U1103]